MDPADYDVAFSIISTAGAAKSSAMMAISSARKRDFDRARAHLSEADESLHEAHRSQTGLLTSEARGEAVPLNIILVHAQDHLTGALLVRDLADEFLALYEQLADRGVQA